MSYNRVNLYHLYTASKLNIKEYRAYEKILSNRYKTSNLGEREKSSVYTLVKELLRVNTPIKFLDNFYYSYTIPHIGKEFDLLKIDNEKILNIELKSENVGLDRIKAQLLRNYHYLKYLSKEMNLFTFISDSKKIYKLNYEQELEECNINDVILELEKFIDDKYPEINSLFKASDYLVSPNTNPIKFINDQYFLTSQQEYIKNKVLDTITMPNPVKITGEAGTGKTLLIFDIAKVLSKSEEVLLINCNNPNEAHNLISRAFNNIKIVTLTDILEDKNILKKYRVILIDEAQRMDSTLWSLISDNLDKKYIFSLDPKQVLTDEEIKSNYSSLIDKLNPIKYKISNRIRINDSIKEFSYVLFNLNRKRNNLDLSCVKIHYTDNEEDLEMYFKIYGNNHMYIKIPTTNYSSKCIECLQIDEVVGKDYENVLMVLDNNYFYVNGKLSTHNSKKNDYLYLKILYQGLSRTRENVVLLIYKNKSLFKELVNRLK